MNGKRPGGWVALAWRYYRDEKLLKVSADAELLWTHALAFTGEQATDGRVPAAALAILSTKLAGPPGVAARELVDVGLWHETPGGWSFAESWSSWQPTAEQVRNARERDAKRKALARLNADSQRDKPRTSDGSHGAIGEGEGEGHSPTSPASPPSGQDSNRKIWLDRGHLFVAPYTTGANDDR